MKTIKLFAIPSHTFVDRVSGVDYIRVTQPMKYLKDYEYEGHTFDVTLYNPRTDPSFDWIDVFKEHDAVFFNYTTNDIAYAVMGTMAQKYKRKLICDFDDDLWNILEDNVAHETFKKGSWGRVVATAVAGDVHHVTVTNRHFKNSLLANTKKLSREVSVLPNYIDLNLYKYRAPFKDRGYYQALHFGSSSHFVSLASDPFFQAMDRVMKEYPNFTFKTIGAFLPSYRQRWGKRYEQGFGSSDLFEWIDKMPSIMDEADFMVVPLIDNVYNRSKSSTKFLEASSYKIPGIYQNIRQYRSMITDGVDGYLATTEEEWYRSIVKMITNTRLRRDMGEAAFETTKKWQMKDHVNEYAGMILNALDKD
jgi:glycosyltransferase involved in cell wall biosynthesis